MRVDGTDIFRAAEDISARSPLGRDEILRERDACLREWDAWRSRRDDGLKLLGARCEEIAGCFPARALFRERVDEETLLRLCRAIGAMREACEGLDAILADGARLGARVRACHVRAMELCREEGDASTVCTCETLWRACAEARERLGELCSRYLPRFFGTLCQKADLEGRGERCDGGAVRALCGELQLALSRGF